MTSNVRSCRAVVCQGRIRRLQSVELTEHPGVDYAEQIMEANMGFGKGALLWLIGIPLPIIILLALFMHH
jgi:hypothetical protein